MSAASNRKIVYKQPVEAVEGAHPQPVRQVAKTLLIAMLVSLILGSHAFQAWANNLPIGPVSDFLLYVAQVWQDWATKLGLTHFAESLRAFLHAFEGSH